MRRPAFLTYANVLLPLKTRRAIVLARKQVGKPYELGAEGPNAFDCSGLLYYVYGKQGVRLPRTSQLQYHHGDPIGRKSIRGGDTLFFVGEGPDAPPRHEGMYLGSGLMIEAPHTGANVRIVHIAGYPGYMAPARRVVR